MKIKKKSHQIDFLIKLVVILILNTFSCASAKEINSSISETKKHNLSVCCIFKNESKFLKEWIEYHKLIGVDHFYLYNVESTDNYIDVLKPYIKNKTVTLIEWPNMSIGQTKPDMQMLSTKIPAYENAAKHLALKNTKWLVFVDIDEFLVAPDNRSLREILAEYDDYPGVILPSDYFDASQIGVFPKKKLIIENTRLAPEPQQPIEKTVEKTIFQPERTVGFTWPPYKYEFENDQYAYVVKRTQLRINHYTNKNVATFSSGKVKDKLVIDNRNLGENEKKFLLERYDIKDSEQSIIRFVPEIRKRMGL